MLYEAALDDIFGERSEMLAEARARLMKLKKKPT
jgi:hypothetical protein